MKVRMRAIRSAAALAGVGVLLVAATQQRPSLCGGAPESRWSAGGATYRPSGVAGNTSATELASITGIAAAGGRVFVHDGQVARIHVLSDELAPLSRFGRRGEGPGELSALPLLAFDPVAHYTANTLAADDSLLYVYDGRRVQQYRHDGTYVEHPGTTSLAFVPHWIRTLAPRPEGVYVGYDSLDLVRGGRLLQTWRLTSAGRIRVHSVSLPAPPASSGSMVRSGRDPRPLWALAGGCVVWADGFNHRLVRIRMRDGATDTVRLPAHRVPPYDYDHAEVSRLARRMGSPPPPRRPRDAPLWHWAGLVVDPDGHVWVRPWTLSGRPEGPVYRVDPWGRVLEERVPAFPEAFGRPGVFYARDRNRATDEILLTRFQKSR
jgi:hypothetical protein